MRLTLAPGINFSARYIPADAEKFPGRAIKDLNTYNHFINVFWLDSTGQEINNWSRNSINPPPPGLFSGREYFKKIKSNELFISPSNSQQKYFLEPIYSWTDREFKVALSIPSRKNGEVAVITFRPQSVMNPVMIAGYTFAVVNNNGLVLFHSDTDKNLNENLQDELTAVRSSTSETA